MRAKLKINFFLIPALAVMLAACASITEVEDPQYVSSFERRDYKFEFKQPVRIGEVKGYADASSQELCMEARCMGIQKPHSDTDEFRRPMRDWKEFTFFGHQSYRRIEGDLVRIVVRTMKFSPNKIIISFDLADEATWMENIVKLEFLGLTVAP